MRLASEVRNLAFAHFEFNGSPVENLNEVKLMQILVWDRDMTEVKFLTIV